LRETPSERLAIVVDNSLSMGALVEGAGRTRLSEAIERAVRILSDAPSHSRIQLFVTSPEFQALLPEPTTKEIARTTLEQIELGYTADELAGQLNPLLASPEWSRIIVVSDTRAGELRRDGTRSRLESIEVPRNFPRGANVAVRVVGIERAGTKRRVRLEIASFGERVPEVRLSLARHLADGSRYPIVERDVKLDGDGKATLNLDNLPDSVAFSATVTVPSVNGVRDILSEDDTTWWTLDAGGAKVGFVSPLPLEKSGLGEIPGIVPVPLSPSATSIPSDTHLVIYHRNAPRFQSQVSTLTILPPSGDGESPLTSVQSARLARWGEHPILRYLHLDLLTPTTMMILSGPAWSEPIVWSEQGPVVRFGLSDDARHVWAGFELLPYEGRESPTLSLFLLNALQWLGNTTFGIGATPSGTRAALSGEVERVIGPEGVRIELARGAAPMMNTPGVYRVEVADASPRVMTVAIPNFDEADIFEATPLTLQQGGSSGRTSGTELQPLTSLLLAFIILLLISEMVLAIIRRQRMAR